MIKALLWTGMLRDILWTAIYTTIFWTCMLCINYRVNVQFNSLKVNFRKIGKNLKFWLVTIFKTISLLFVAFSTDLHAVEDWPKGNKVAISLSYDDALNSQLNNALPALNKRGMKASFYVVPFSHVFRKRLEEWRLLATQGHELGNHTLFHACKRSKPGRKWVKAINDLDKKTVAEMVREVTLANTLLTAMDGQTERTFTPPCFDQVVSDGNYIDAVKKQFVGIKSLEDSNFASLIGANKTTAQNIIKFIEKQPKNIKLVNILFHGIGGDHIVTSTDEHNKLLDYLLENKDKYWVDTYRNIMMAKNKN